MGIILSVLKIIGIILLVILILLLVLSTLLLFVPFTYKGDGTYKDEKIIIRLRVHYLFPLFSARFRYDGDPYGKIRILGIPVYDFFAPEKPEKVKKDKKKKDKLKKDKLKKNKENVSESFMTESQGKVASADKADTADKVDTTDKADTLNDKKHLTDDISISSSENQEENKKQSFLDKLKIFWENLKEKYFKLKQFFINIKKKTFHLKKQVKKTVSVIMYYKEAFEQEETKLALQKAQLSIFSLLKKISPRKGLLHVHFGMDDPSVTGEICAFAGMMYPFIGKYVMIEPDFGQVILEADMNFKGHITLFTLLRTGWIYLFDKQIKHLKDIVQKANIR